MSPADGRSIQESRQIYVCPRTGPQYAHLSWPSVAKLQAASVPIAWAAVMEQTDGQSMLFQNAPLGRGHNKATTTTADLRTLFDWVDWVDCVADTLALLVSESVSICSWWYRGRLTSTTEFTWYSRTVIHDKLHWSWLWKQAASVIGTLVMIVSQNDSYCCVAALSAWKTLLHQRERKIYLPTT